MSKERVLTRSLTKRLNESNKNSKIQSPPPSPPQKKATLQNQPKSTNPKTPIQPNSLPKTGTKIEDLYKNLYFPPAYSGNSQELINTIETYSVHRPRRQKFKRRTTYVPGKSITNYHILETFFRYVSYSFCRFG